MASAPSYGINFIDEDEAWSAFSRLIKHIPHATGSHTHKHFDKIRSADAEKRSVSFSSDGLG